MALVKNIMYVMIATRPKIAATIGIVSHFMQNPRYAHWRIVKQIMRYFQRMRDYWLQYIGIKKDHDSMIFTSY